MSEPEKPVAYSFDLVGHSVMVTLTYNKSVGASERKAAEVLLKRLGDLLTMMLDVDSTRMH